ncbi:MAG: hypothetical protein JRH15_15645 [Deltaproteobacteria bacterium]|nr:hypothetical protein [Deltaproteobacteria bacterium]
MKKLKSVLTEARLYQSQGLLNEAWEKYEAARSLVLYSKSVKKKSILLDGIDKKLKSLGAVVNKVEKKTAFTEISPKDKDLIKRLFSSANGDDEAKALLEGAVALAKFGQFDRAIHEFEELLPNPHFRVTVAKYIMRCHRAIGMLHDPVSQYHKWVSNSPFSEEEIEEISVFLQEAYGIDTDAESGPMGRQVGALTEPGSKRPQSASASGDKDETANEQPPEYDPYEDEYVDILQTLKNTDAQNIEPHNDADDYVDAIEMPNHKQTLRYDDIEKDTVSDYVDYISAVRVPGDSGSGKDASTELPVNLQNGNEVNLIVPKTQINAMKRLKKGARIENLSLVSPISMSTGSGLVTSVVRIDQGPHKGAFSVDIKIIN